MLIICEKISTILILCNGSIAIMPLHQYLAVFHGHEKWNQHKNGLYMNLENKCVCDVITFACHMSVQILPSRVYGTLQFNSFKDLRLNRWRMYLNLKFNFTFILSGMFLSETTSDNLKIKIRVHCYDTVY